MDKNKQENENVTKTEEKNVVESNLKEILDKIVKSKELSKEEVAILQEESKERLEFMKLIENIELPKDNYVIFTDGEEQLVYENGEFFIVSTTDSTKVKTKKKRLEAKDMYIEYFIRYTLNKINSKQIENKEIVKSKIEISKENKNKTEEVKNKESKKTKENEKKRAEEIKESLKTMVKPVTEDYEKSKIISKIKNGKEKNEKIR